MAMMVALGMSITWMAVIAVLVLAQKLLPVTPHRHAGPARLL
jgi:predicted metal-binding membrane protein